MIADTVVGRNWIISFWFYAIGFFPENTDLRKNYLLFYKNVFLRVSVFRDARPTQTSRSGRIEHWYLEVFELMPHSVWNIFGQSKLIFFFKYVFFLFLNLHSKQYHLKNKFLLLICIILTYLPVIHFCRGISRVLLDD